MNTAPVDAEGTDLVQLVSAFPGPGHIMFNFQYLPPSELNMFYNAADVTLNIAFNEGLGLCIGESLLAGTPCIATATGGIPEQLSDTSSSRLFGIPITPTTRELFGTPDTPYIFRDFVAYSDIVAALCDVRARGDIYRNLALDGRQHIIRNYHIDTTICRWHEVLQEIHTRPSTYCRYNLTTFGPGGE